jgi:hypothetical protein
VAAMSALPWTASGVAAQVNATIQLVQPVEAIFVADLTPMGADRNPDFIAITLTQPAGRSQQLVLEINARMESPDRLQIVRGTTDPFLLSEPVRRITNRDIARPNSDVEVTDYEVDPQSERLARSSTLPSCPPAPTCSGWWCGLPPASCSTPTRCGSRSEALPVCSC